MKKFTIRLDDDLDKKLEEYAKQNDMSKNKVIRKLIRELEIKK